MLCDEHSPKSVSPYGGRGELVVADSSKLLQVEFVNTTDEHSLGLSSVGETTAANSAEPSMRSMDASHNGARG